MRDTKEQLRWQIQVLKTALQMASFQFTPPHPSTFWIEQAALALTQRNCMDAIDAGIRAKRKESTHER